MAEEVANRVRRRRVWKMLGAGTCVLLVVPVGCAVHAAHAARNMPEVEVAAEITATEGTYQRDSIAPALCVLFDGWVMEYGPVIWVWHSAPLTEAKMAPLVKLGHLEELTVISPDVPGHPPLAGPPVPSDPAAWPWLSKLSTLRRVCVIRTDIRDDDLVHLHHLPRLRRIDLWHNPNLTAAGVDRLRRARPDVHINYP
jgi:hypothetical protein